MNIGEDANFYSIETTVDGKSFVTARGWSDLSDMMQLYERNGIAVDEKLIGQYLQNRNIAKDFAIYYDLYNKYKSDYQVADILSGRVSEEIKSRARDARFDERLALLGLLLDNVAERFRGVYLDELALLKLMTSLQALKKEFSRPGSKYGPLTGKLAEKQREQLERDRRASLLSPEDEQAGRRTVAALGELRERLEERNPPDGASALKILRDDFNRRQKDAKKPAAEAEKALANLFRFCEEVFPDGQELLILVTELTLNFYSAQFISRHGSPEYFAHNKELLFYERQKEIIRQLDVLDLDDWRRGTAMPFEPWMLGMMEERGYMDTKEGHINRVARYMAQNVRGEVDRAAFERVCAACDVDPRSFSQQDLNEIQRKLDALTGC